MGTDSLESMLVCTKSTPQQERKPRPQPEQALKCPRCDSTNTKFCYYNNYSLSQPRYFCKSCRRYWTKGGTLRNVPVGGGCRKNKRSSSSSSTSSTTSSKRIQDQLNQPLLTPNLPHLTYHNDTTDLSLAFARLQKQTNHQLGGFLDHHNHHQDNFPIIDINSNTLQNPNSSFIDTHQSFLQNMYYGFGGEVASNESGEMLFPYGDMNMSTNATTTAVTVTTMKQEFCNNNSRENESKILWGFPWQINGDSLVGNGGNGDVDSGKESWNGLNSSSWHNGLLNSPLM